MHSNIIPHESWDVIDSTKIQTYLECPRRFFYEYMLGWKPDKTSIHLVFGEAWHIGMEVLLQDGYNPKGIARAYELLNNKYREHFPSGETDEAREPKTPANAFTGLIEYCQRYMSDNFEVLYTEVTGSLILNPARTIVYKTDAVVRNLDKIYCLEHKTSTRHDKLWSMQWSLKFQLGTYSHLLYHLISRPEEFGGIIVNGFFVHKPTKTKKDFTHDFERITIRRNIKQMQAWLWEANDILDDLEFDIHRLDKVSPDETVMKAFRKNPQSCTNYGGCPFHDLCTIWENPVRNCDRPPVGYKQDFWNPLKEYSEVKNKVDLSAKELEGKNG